MRVVGGHGYPTAAFLRQHRFGEPSPIARTQWQYRVVEIVMRVVQHSSALGAAVANPDIGVPGFPSRKQAKSSAPMLGNRSRLTSLSPTSDAVAVAAISVSGAALAVSGWRRSDPMPPLSHRDIKIGHPTDDPHSTFPAAQTVPCHLYSTSRSA